MRVSAPWRFQSKNLHLRLRLDRKINLEDRFRIKPNKYFSNYTDEILITFSDVVSSINEKDNIVYHENIVKCKVEYEGKMYYYPIITFVDNAYSIIRGYYLGFEKCISDIFINESKISVTNMFIDFSVNIKRKSLSKSKSFETYPFILICDWKFDDDYVKDEIVTLKTKDYGVNEIATFDISEDNIDRIIEAIGLERKTVIGIEKVYIDDEFVLEGVVKLNN